MTTDHHEHRRTQTSLGQSAQTRAKKCWYANIRMLSFLLASFTLHQNSAGMQQASSPTQSLVQQSVQVPPLQFDGASIATVLTCLTTQDNLPRDGKKRALSFLTNSDTPSLEIAIEKRNEHTQELCTLLTSDPLRGPKKAFDLNELLEKSDNPHAHTLDAQAAKCLREAIIDAIKRVNALLENGADLAQALRFSLPTFEQVEHCPPPIALTQSFAHEFAQYAYKNPSICTNIYLLSFLFSRGNTPPKQRAAQRKKFNALFFDAAPATRIFGMYPHLLGARALAQALPLLDQEILPRIYGLEINTQQNTSGTLKQWWLNERLVQATLPPEGQSPDTKKVALLLEHGANPLYEKAQESTKLVDMRPPLCHQRTDDNSYYQRITPFHGAAYTGNEQLIRLFCLALAANPDYQKLLETPLQPDAGIPYGGKTAAEIAHAEKHAAASRILSLATQERAFEL